MNRKTLFPAAFLALLALVLTFTIVFAHEGVKVGNYEIEVGWLDEPPVVGLRNAVVINVADTTNEDKKVDVSQLLVTVAYGGQTKALKLQPLSEESKNQYIAPIIPTIAGEYTIQLRGKIANEVVNSDVAIEEVTPTDSLAFPNTSAGQPAQPAPIRLVDWVSIGALVIALAALVLSLRKSRA